MKLITLVLYCSLMCGCVTRDVSQESDIPMVEYEDRYEVRTDFPQWFYALRAQRSIEESATCSVIKGNGFEFENAAMLKAKQAARIELAKKLSGKQKLFATEELVHNDGTQEYSAKIKSKTYGSLSRNYVNKKVFIKIKGVKYLCLSIKLM